MEVPNMQLCQSCAMPLSVDEDHGDNRDGSRNDEFCRFCFKEGDFVDPEITMQEKIDKLVRIAVTHMDMTEEKALEMAKGIIPQLKRWKVV